MDKFEAFDPALKELMGSRYQEQPVKKPAAKPVRKPVEEPIKEPIKEPIEEPVSGGHNWLKVCIKRAWIYSALSLLFFYWQQTGLMDSAAAVPSIYVCALLFGLTVGKSMAERR